MIYKVKIDSHCYSDNLLCHSKYFGNNDNAKDYLDKTLDIIIKKYGTAPQSACEEYGFSEPCEYRVKPKYDLNALVEVEVVINYRNIGSKYEDRIYVERVFITLEPIKLEDE